MGGGVEHHEQSNNIFSIKKLFPQTQTSKEYHTHQTIKSTPSHHHNTPYTGAPKASLTASHIDFAIVFLILFTESADWRTDRQP